MRAMTIPEPGGPDALVWTEVPDAVPGQGEVLVQVVASAVNRADLLQRQGKYPPPPGASPYPGMECSGRIVALGTGVAGWRVGEEVCALLAGGGYAELVAVPSGQILPIPVGVSLMDTAALPEVCCTVWSNLVMVARLRPGETVLIHGGSSGIGTMAIQIAARRGAKAFCTVGSEVKRERCRRLGADLAIDYRNEDFVAAVREQTGGRGVDVILDIMGASYLDRNIDALAPGGRLVIIGTQGGATAELNIGKLLVKRGSVTATTLRSRSLAEKAEIVTAVHAHVWPMIDAGDVRPVVDRVLPIAQAAEAHRVLESSSHIGKVLLSVIP